MEAKRQAQGLLKASVSLAIKLDLDDLKPSGDKWTRCQHLHALNIVTNAVGMHRSRAARVALLYLCRPLSAPHRCAATRSSCGAVHTATARACGPTWSRINGRFERSYSHSISKTTQRLRR